MFSRKLLFIGALMTALIIAGCVKKQGTSENSFKQNSDSTAQSSAPKAAESEDIFDEFYKDENASSQKEKLTSKNTFYPSGKNTSEKTSFSDNGRYVVQISTVRSQSFAEKLKGKLEAAGFPAYVTEVQNPTPALYGTFYRIRIGTFNTLSAARNFGETALKDIGYEYWVDYKSNDMVGIEGYGLGNSGSSYNNSPAPVETPVSNSETTGSSSDWNSSSSNSAWGAESSQSTPAATPAPTGSAVAEQPPAPAPTPAPANSAPAPETNSTSGSNESDSWGESTGSSGW